MGGQGLVLPNGQLVHVTIVIVDLGSFRLANPHPITTEIEIGGKVEVEALHCLATGRSAQTASVDQQSTLVTGIVPKRHHVVPLGIVVGIGGKKLDDRNVVFGNEENNLSIDQAHQDGGSIKGIGKVCHAVVAQTDKECTGRFPSSARGFVRAVTADAVGLEPKANGSHIAPPATGGSQEIGNGST